MTSAERLSPAVRVPIAGLLAWLVPGLGHLFAGDRSRGIIILVTLTLTFWTGIAIGGVRSTIDPQRKKLWFMAQICAGSHTLAAFGWGEHARGDLTTEQLATSQWASTEVALVYTGVAGLLNLLAIMDALVRADPAGRRRQPAATVPSKVGAT